MNELLQKINIRIKELMEEGKNELNLPVSHLPGEEIRDLIESLRSEGYSVELFKYGSLKTLEISWE